MQLYKYIINPYILYSIVWMFTLSIYPLGWTSLYPNLTLGLVLFICITSLLSFIWGIYKIKTNSFHIVNIYPNKKYYKKLLKVSIITIIFLALEFVIFGSIPLINYILGNANLLGNYNEFGIPVIHVIVMTAYEFIQIFCFHCFLKCKDRIIKKKFLILYLGNMIVLSLVMNRGILMYTIFGSILIFFMVKKRILRYIAKLFLFIFVIFWLFGLLGNLRTGSNIEEGKELILELGGATNSFRESIVPNELFWPYIYITSPLSNVQYNIKNTEVDFNERDLVSFFVNDCLPQTISKRLDMPYKKGKLINDSLNVGSVYMRPYANLGWLGMVLIYIFMFVFIEINIRLISRNSPLFPSLIVIIDLIVIFNVFDNMFIFSGLVPAVLIAIYLAGIKYFPRRLHISNKRYSMKFNRNNTINDK